MKTIIFTVALIFISHSQGCELKLGAGSELCTAVNDDVKSIADISQQCNCATIKAGCDELEQQRQAGKYDFVPVCEAIKTVVTKALQAGAAALLNCGDKSLFKNSYAKIDECNAQNAAKQSTDVMMIEASTSISEMMAGQSTQMLPEAFEAKQTMTTAMDMDMLSSMMEMSTSMKITPSSSSMVDMVSSSVTPTVAQTTTPGAANQMKMTYVVLIFTALVAVLFSLM